MSDTHQSRAGTAATERYEALFRVSQTLISIRSSEELFRLLARELHGREILEGVSGLTRSQSIWATSLKAAELS